MKHKTKPYMETNGWRLFTNVVQDMSSGRVVAGEMFKRKATRDLYGSIMFRRLPPPPCFCHRKYTQIRSVLSSATFFSGQKHCDRCTLYRNGSARLYLNPLLH